MDRQVTPLGILLGIAITGGVILIIRKKAPPAEPYWQIGDVLWCEAYGDPGHFYIADRRPVNGSWEYHIWEGVPGYLLEDIGWVTEDALLAAPMACRISI